MIRRDLGFYMNAYVESERKRNLTKEELEELEELEHLAFNEDMEELK